MRKAAALLIGLALVSGFARAQGDKKGIADRFGVPAERERYPQDTPQKALASVLRAIDNNQVDYLLAHLADPRFVDKRVGDHEALYPNLDKPRRQRAAFEKLVQVTEAHFREEPNLVKDLRRFSSVGEWEAKDKEASAKLKDLPSRRVFLRRVETGWVLEDRQK
jgi:hypothetical protein